MFCKKRKRNACLLPIISFAVVVWLQSCDLFFASGKPDLHFDNNNVVVFTGGANISNMRKDAYLETMLVAAHKNKRLHFRNMGWEGDTVYDQYREDGFGEWTGHLDSVGADMIFMQFGQMESLDGEQALRGFIDAYKQLLVSAKGNTRQLVILSPIPFEPAALSVPQETLVSVPIVNAPVDKYVDAIEQMAKEEKCVFVNLYQPFKTSKGSFTSNGVHLTDTGQKLAAETIMKELGLPAAYQDKWEPLRTAILHKNELWFHYWRTGNWAFIYGNEYVQQFSRDWKNRDHRILPEERNAIRPYLDSAEQRIEKAKLNL